MRDEEKNGTERENETLKDREKSHEEDRGAGLGGVKRVQDSETGAREGGVHRAKKKKGGRDEKRHRGGAAEQGNTRRIVKRQIREEEAETADHRVAEREAVDPEAGQEKKGGNRYRQMTKWRKKISGA